MEFIRNTLIFIEHFPFVSGIITFAIGFGFMPFVIKFAKKRNLVVRPNKRTSHVGKVPNIGGLNIFMSLSAVVLLLFVFGKLSIPFLIGYCIIFLIGFIDDRLVLSGYWKILGETLSALLLIYFANIRITSDFGIFGIGELPIYVSYIVSLLVFLLIVNAQNLIDGVDGLASGLGVIYSLFFGIWFHLSRMPFLAFLCYALVGSLTVFFLYNVFGRTKRKIFMGDSGSLVIGYLISYFVFVFFEKHLTTTCSFTTFYSPVATVLTVLFIPIFDIIRVALTRLKYRKSLLEPDKNHIHHLLLRLGLSHKQVTASLCITSLVFVSIAVLLKNYNFLIQLAIIFLVGALLIFLLWRLIDKKNQKMFDQQCN